MLKKHLKKTLIILLVTLATFITLLFGYYKYDEYISESLKTNYVKNLNSVNSNKTKSNKKSEISIINKTELLKLNSNYLGWLKIDDSNIDTSIVLGDRYFRKDLKGKYSLAGTPFIKDYDLSKNAFVIYGHNLGYGRKDAFHDITKYSDVNFYNNHRNVYFTEKSQLGNKYIVVAYMEFDLNKLDTFNYVDVDFNSVEKYQNWKKGIIDNSKYVDDNFKNLKYGTGRYMVLSTCHSSTWVDDNVRSVLICYQPQSISNVNYKYFNDDQI